MKVLAIDTSTRACSVALIKDDFVAGESILYGLKNHSEGLLNLVDELFGKTGVSPDEIDLIAVTSGPGSFTGLRVGIATAQGLAFSLGKDLIGVSTLDVLAYQAFTLTEYICPMMDARKQQVFACLFRCSKSGQLEKVIEETVVEPENWLKRINKHSPIVFLGDGAISYREQIESAFSDNFLILPRFRGIPRASTVAHIAEERHRQSRSNELESIAPLYVRPPDSELKSGKKRGSFNPLANAE